MANHIKLFMHCTKCMEDIKRGVPVSPAEYARLEVGWTVQGLQVWCQRHDVNVVHIDFEEHKHPAVTDTIGDFKRH